MDSSGFRSFYPGSGAVLNCTVLMDARLRVALFKLFRLMRIMGYIKLLETVYCLGNMDVQAKVLTPWVSGLRYDPVNGLIRSKKLLIFHFLVV